MFTKKPARPLVVLYLDYVDLLGGDHLAALMLSRIVYWYLPSPTTGEAKLRIEREGQWWLVKSHLDWQAECQLTRRQAGRCLAVLKAAGLITARLRLFKGKPTVHVQLVLARGQASLARAPERQDFEAAVVRQSLKVVSIARGGAMDCTPGYNGMSPTVQLGTCTTNIDSLMCSGEQTRHGDQDKLDQVSQDEDEDHVDVGSVLGVTMNANDVIKAARARRDLGTTLPTIWQRLCTTEFGTYQHALTAKEKGQLSRLKKLLGEHATTVVEYVVTHWWQFGTQAQAQGGAGFPPKPHIGFLLKYCAIAEELALGVQSAGVTPAVSLAAETPQGETDGPALPVSEADLPHLLTTAELAALLADLKE